MVLRCLGAVYSITTFMRDMRTLLQIRQFAHRRSTTCSLQGLSSTQRSARAAPSRDLTLGVKEQKRNSKRLSVPRSRKSTREDRIERNPTVAVLPPMGEGHQTTTFIRAITSLLQIRQFARLRSASCSLPGLSSTQRSARATPSRDLTLGVGEQGTRGNYHSHLKANP